MTSFRGHADFMIHHDDFLLRTMGVFEERNIMQKDNVRPMIVYTLIAFKLLLGSMSLFASGEERSPTPPAAIPDDKDILVKRPDCISEEKKSKTAVEYELGCFGWSEQHKKAACVVGYSGWQIGVSFSLASLPNGLFDEMDYDSCLSERWNFTTALILDGDMLKQFQHAVKKEGITPLPPPLFSLTPRNTVDLVLSQNIHVRLRWNQFVKRHVDSGVGEWDVYRDRISIICAPSPKAEFPQKDPPRFTRFPNRKAPALPKKSKSYEQDVYEDEGPGRSQEAKVYVLSGGRYLLVDIEKPYGIEGDYGRYTTAALVDLTTCKIEQAE